MRGIKPTIAALFAALTVAAVSTVSCARSAHAQTSAPARIVLRPSDAKGNEVPGPGYYSVNAAPGTPVQLYALVGNQGQQPVKVKLVPVDASSGVYGGVSYNLPTQPRKHLGAWVKLSVSELTIPPGKYVVVPFTLYIPGGQRSGQFIGGLTAYQPAPTRKLGTFGGIQVQYRVIDAILANVSGPQRWQFTVRNVVAQNRPFSYFIITNIKNTGNMLLKGSGHLWVWQRGVRAAVVDRALSIDTTVPQSTVHYPIRWVKRPQKGVYSYSVQVSWNGGKMVKKGTFVVR